MPLPLSLFWGKLRYYVMSKHDFGHSGQLVGDDVGRTETLQGSYYGEGFEPSPWLAMQPKAAEVKKPNQCSTPECKAFSVKSTRKTGTPLCVTCVKKLSDVGS